MQKQAIQKKKKTFPKRALIFCGGTVLATIFLFTFYILSVMQDLPEVFDPNTIPSTPEVDVNLNLPEVSDSMGGVLKREDGFYNILILGTDKGGGNTDTIMLCSIDTKDQKISVLQIPRDTLLNVQRNNKMVNAAYAIGGIDGIKKDLSSMLAVNIDRYVVVSTKAFREIVDTIGGVEVDVPQNMKYVDPYQNLTIDISAGKQVLNGEKAEGFVRFRSYADADLGRIKAQKLFLSALITKLKTPAMVLKIPNFVNIALENVKTDMSLEDMIFLANQAVKAQNENIKFFTLPGQGVGSRYGAYKEETIKIINEHFNPYTTELNENRFNFYSFKRTDAYTTNTDGYDLDEAIDTALSKAVRQGSVTAATDPAAPTNPPETEPSTTSTEAPETEPGGNKSDVKKPAEATEPVVTEPKGPPVTEPPVTQPPATEPQTTNKEGPPPGVDPTASW